jgi:hypothetical protein
LGGTAEASAGGLTDARKDISNGHNITTMIAMQIALTK